MARRLTEDGGRFFGNGRKSFNRGWTRILNIRLRQGACCPNQKERGPVARSNLIPAETSEIFPSLGKSDIAAAHRAALRHLGNTPQGYGGQAVQGSTPKVVSLAAVASFPFSFSLSALLLSAVVITRVSRPRDRRREAGE